MDNPSTLVQECSRSKESFEGQVAALRRFLSTYRAQLTAVEQKHLACAARNLELLGLVRRTFMAQAACADASEEVSEDLVKHLVRLLHMPGAE